VRLIDDDTDEAEELPAPDEPPVLEPPDASRAGSTATRVETQRSSPPLIRWIIAAVIVVILAFLILLLARWIYHKSHHKVQPVPATSQQTSKNPGLNTQSGSSQQTGGASNSANNGPAANNGTSSLPNNGPGNVAGVFALSTATAAGLHYVIRSRRLGS
jgi:cytoskeletal protein RodZ